MGKGLIRSLSRGPILDRAVIPHRETFDLTISVSSNLSGQGGGGTVVFPMPEGNFIVLGSHMVVEFDAGPSGGVILPTWGGNFGVGTEQETLGTGLFGDNVNVLPATAISSATSSVSPTVNARGAASPMFDNTDANLNLFLNLEVNSSDIPGTVTGDVRARGVFNMLYGVIGDD